MITENEDWKPRNHYNNNGDDADGQRAKRPYQSYNRSSNYGNYRNSEGNSSYGQNEGGGYTPRPRTSYNRPAGGFDRPNNYERREGGYTPRPRPSDNYQRRSYDNNQYSSYDNRQTGNQDAEGAGMVRKRRPRVGEAPQQPRNTNYNRPQTGGYNRYNNQQSDYRQGGGYQQRPQGARPKFNRNATQTQQPYQKKTSKYREENFDPNEELRLNKYLANAGVCSRREADEFIKAGVVKVNGNVITELGTKVKRADEVFFHDEPVKLEQKVYVLLNKPRNCVTTADDPQERLTVMDMVKTACTERIFPVGRLDRNTTGVLLLTNDGDLSSKLTHPKYLKKKIYHAWLDKPVSVEDMQKMADGVELEDGEIHADAISYVTDEEQDKNQVGVEIHSGRNRVVRRMFESLGYHVIKLDRVYFAGLTKKNLKRGQWRYLSEKEVSLLRMGAFD
jgi:23S rRNA pseudouridine2605 synthase